MRGSLTIAVLLLSVHAGAQVVSPAGTTDVMLTVQHTHIDSHTDRTGVLQHNIDLRSVIATIGIEYSVTDRFAIGASLPYIQSRYRGPVAHPGAVVDDGLLHATLQDLQLEARYALMRGDWVVTPFAGLRHPARDYPTIGHAAPGRGLKELELGVSTGHQLVALPDAVIGATLAYTISEAVEEIRVNRTNADLQMAYAVTPRLWIRGFGAWQRSHGGLDLPIPPTAEHFHHHDQLARANHVRAGAGVIFSITETVNVHAAYSAVLESVNAHIGRSVSLGTSWTFMPRVRERKREPGPAARFIHHVPIDEGF